jgi:SOS response regulatory protein OraA/RecX
VELQKRRSKSDRTIRAELFKKGLNRELVYELMADESDDEEQRLRVLIAKKIKSSRYKHDKIKFAKYLTSQGFSYHLVKEQLSLQQFED